MFGAETVSFDIGANLTTVIMALVTFLNTYLVLSRTKELKPNGGNSTKDKVDKLYSTLVEPDTATPVQVEVTKLPAPETERSS